MCGGAEKILSLAFISITPNNEYKQVVCLAPNPNVFVIDLLISEADLAFSFKTKRTNLCNLASAS